MQYKNQILIWATKIERAVMFKGIKVLVIMFVVYFGLLNAMDSEDIPMPVDAPWSITSNKVIGSSQPSLLTQIKEMPSAAAVFSDEEISFSAPHVSNRKKPRGNLFNIAMLPVVLGVRTFVGITKFLERRPVLRTATVCVVQGLGEAVTHNPQEAFSLVNSGFAKCGGAVCKYFGPKEIAGTAGGLIVLIGPMLPHISSALPSILSGGGLFATLWVKNRVNAIGTQLDQTSQILQKKLDDFRKEEQEQHTETRKEIANLLQKMADLQQELKTAQTQLEGRIDQESGKIQAKIVELSGQVSAVFNRAGELDTKFNTMQESFDAMQKSVSENNERIAKRAAEIEAYQVRTEKKVDDISKKVVDISEQQKEDSKTISATNGRVKSLQRRLTNVVEKVDEFQRNTQGFAVNLSKEISANDKAMREEIKCLEERLGKKIDASALAAMNGETLFQKWLKEREQYVNELLEKLEKNFTESIAEDFVAKVSNEIAVRIESSTAKSLIEFEKKIQDQFIQLKVDQEKTNARVDNLESKRKEDNDRMKILEEEVKGLKALNTDLLQEIRDLRQQNVRQSATVEKTLKEMKQTFQCSVGILGGEMRNLAETVRGSTRSSMPALPNSDEDEDQSSSSEEERKETD